MRREKTFVPAGYPLDELQSESEDKIDGELECDEKPDTCADPYEAPSTQERPLIMEHHILWSMNYSVPVIYFNGWKSGESSQNYYL